MNTPSVADISALRCYDKAVDDVTYKVPRGIARDSRSRAWISRVIKDKRLVVYARFTDNRFEGTQRALDAAIIHLIHSGYAQLSDEVLTLSSRAAIHWRKRSGIGLCAVAYVTSAGSGRGETFFLSTYRRVSSGQGMDKLHEKMLTVMYHAYQIEHDCTDIPRLALNEMQLKLYQLWRSPEFYSFLEAGRRKADKIAMAEYINQA
jgi:hypothetical protein